MKKNFQKSENLIEDNQEIKKELPIRNIESEELKNYKFKLALLADFNNARIKINLLTEPKLIWDFCEEKTETWWLMCSDSKQLEEDYLKLNFALMVEVLNRIQILRINLERDFEFESGWDAHELSEIESLGDLDRKTDALNLIVDCLFDLNIASQDEIMDSCDRGLNALRELYADSIFRDRDLSKLTLILVNRLKKRVNQIMKNN